MLQAGGFNSSGGPRRYVTLALTMNEAKTPDRIELTPGLEVPRILVGLWQVADMERDGRSLDPEQAAQSLAEYVEAGFDTFDMADHYGSAEIIVGKLLSRTRSGDAGINPGGVRSFPGGVRSFPSGVRAFTKWCPTPGPMTPEIVRTGVQRSLDRLAVSQIDLLQFHWWNYAHPGYLDAMTELARLRDQGLIRQLGLTNFDTDHLRLLVRQGVPVLTNQVCFSLLDRRAQGAMTRFCLQSGVRLLAYGALAGGFLSDRWLGQPEPYDVVDWSKSKYKRFVDSIGGWAVLQLILKAARQVADKHQVSIANVAVRWVLEQPAVGAVIVGARPGERAHHADNLAVFSFKLDAADHARIDDALAGASMLPGDCGDEYRKPPFLTASGDLSHHLDSFDPVFPAQSSRLRPDRRWVDSGSVWEPLAGYARALRDGQRILVSGTTATHGDGTVVCPGDAEGQMVYVLDKIRASIESLGGRMEDVIRTRVYLRDASAWEGVARVHGRYFGEIRPVNTLLGGASLIGGYEVEVEAEASVASESRRPQP